MRQRVMVATILPVLVFVVSISFFLNDGWLPVLPRSFTSVSGVATLRPAMMEVCNVSDEIFKI